MDFATLRDGTVLNLGDEVTTDYRGCKGYTFIVCEINPYEYCESKTMVVAHLKDSPQRRIRSPFAGRDGRPDGLDANWFKKVS